MVGMIRVLGVSRFAIALLLGTFWLAPVARAQDAADLLLRLDRLEAENRRLTGQVEELRFQLRKVEDQNRRFQTDTDTRFRDLEGTRGVIRTSPTAPVAPTTPQKRSDAFDPASAPPAAPGTPRPLGSQGVATAPGAPLPIGGLPPGGQPIQSGDIGAPIDVTGRRPPVPAPDALPRGDAKSDFDFAKALIDRGDYEQSEGAFRDYLRTYSKDKRVPEATFWLGESYLRRTRYREAAEHFLTVTSKYSSATRAPEAMLKLGISLRGLSATAEACATFAQVTKKYPNASPAIKQAVDREKARAQC
jgi:tol-pal system protein YbgF